MQEILLPLDAVPDFDSHCCIHSGKTLYETIFGESVLASDSSEKEVCALLLPTGIVFIVRNDVLGRYACFGQF